MRFGIRSAALLALALFAAACADRDTVNPVLTTNRQFVLNADPNGVRISEIHYDNAGTDAGERIEVSGPAGFDFTGWSLVLYNGSGGAIYRTDTLGGLTVATCNGRSYVFVSYPVNGIQNGNPDAVALVNASGQLVEFLSYGGVQTGVGGAAAGQVSTNIGITETATTPVGHSLQRAGVQNVWAAGVNTFGTCNFNEQVIEVGPVTRVDVTPTADTIEVAGQATFTARGYDAQNRENAAAVFTWTSSDETVATVSNGVVTGVRAGTAFIIATTNGVADSAQIRVNDPPPPPDLPIIRFSELHYDNAGVDAGEAIEVEAPAGTNLTGWQIVLYNETGGVAYNTQTLLGTVLNRCNGRGVIHVTYPQDGIQNGPNDGFALVNPSGQVIEFLSYEGHLTATNGPAVGLTSRNIGVSQTNAPLGSSLQRNASGIWSSRATSTFGACNDGDVPPPPAPGLVISEIMANPLFVADDAGEWFEIYNPTTETVDLFGWIISSTTSQGAENHLIAQHIMIAPKSFVVLGNNANSGSNGNVPVAYSYGTSITLSNSSAAEFLELKDPGVRSVDRVNWGAYAPVAGVARAVLDATFDNLDILGINWEDAETLYNTVDRGTPGTGDYGERGPIVEVIITPSSSFVSTTGTRQFRGRGRDAQGRTVGTPLTWSSNATGVATIDATTGLARGVSVGDATITATAPNGVAGNAQLRVLAPGTPAYTTVTLENNIPAGFVKRAFYNVFDADGTNIPTPSSQITWSTSNNIIATVDARGYVTGHQAGPVQIIATHQNGATGFTNYTILPATASTSAVYRNHLEFGVPTDSDMSDDILMNKPQFSVSYSTARGGPNWVSWNINGTQFGFSGRCNCFSPDPALPVPQVEDADYIGSGYDRGHMVQSDSRTTTVQENAPTFLMSNILPQSPHNNQGPWQTFELFLNNLAELSGREIYVIAGGQYAAIPQTLNNAGKVQIPDYTWKVAVVVPAGTGLNAIDELNDLTVYAIRMPNLLSTTDQAMRDDPWQQYEVTVDQIEAAVGYDVLALLPDNIEIAVESKTKPPVAVALAPFASAEGSSVAMTGSATDPDGDALTYTWSFGDGATATGSAVTHTYAQDGTYNVRLIVTDIRGLADTVTTVANVGNVAPVIAAFGGATLLPGETYNAAGAFADPGADTWTATVDYGSGAGALPLGLTGQTFTLSNTYATAGTYTVTVVVNDDDASATRTATVTVLTIAASLTNANALVEQLVAAGKLTRGNANSLTVKIDAAAASMAAFNAAAAANQLNALLNELDAMVRAGRLTTEDASALRTLVNRIIASITE
jgi:DNA/RNA endonuclease G (NUC1)